MKEKLKYEKAEVEVILLEKSDIITTSNKGDGDEGGWATGWT